MAASFPTSLKSFTQQTDNTDTADAADVNAIYDEVEAIEAHLGAGDSINDGQIELGAASGDVWVRFDIGGTDKFTLGIDDSDGDKFKINSGSGLGDPSDFELDSSGNVEIAGDLLPGSAGGTDLGSTSAELGDIFLSDSKSVKFGADQDVALTHDGTAGLNVVLADNVANALDVKEGSNSYLKIVTTDNGEKLTIATVQDIEINSGETATDSVKIQAYDVGAAGQETLITAAAHATTPTLTLAASGGIAVSNAITMADTMDILAGAVGGCDLGSTTAEWGDIFLADSKNLKFGSDQDASFTHDGTTGLDLSVADNDSGAFDIKESTTSYLTIDTTDNKEQILFGKPIDPKMGRKFTFFELFDDFLYQTIAETDTPWILNKGSDASAADPAINAQASGVIRCTTGAGDGSTAQDGSQLVAHIPVQADSGNLIFEARLRINTAITNLAVNVGLTDSTGLEEPFTIGGSDVITSNAADAACFVYDTSADTDQWFACAVDSDTDDTGNATTGTAPTADTYQTFRIEVSSDGATIRFYIDGTLETTLSGAAGVSPSVGLYATVIACGDGTASKTVDVDYIYVGTTR